MKRFIVAAAFAALATPTFAAEIWLPYEKDQFDRTLPELFNPAPAAEASASSGATSAPRAGGWASGVWARDHNFVAPAP
jgi:hypothetical protein